VRQGAALIELCRCSLILDGHVVLDAIDFALRRGERWALIGPNGSGKTLLLKMLRGDVWPTPTGGERRTARLDKEHIAYVGPERQDKYVRYGWDLTVAQVVTTGLFDEDIPLTQPSRAQRQRVARVLGVSRWSLARSPAMLACCCWTKSSTVSTRARAKSYDALSSGRVAGTIGC
jgi:molybdate transport system ATP-binding protein